MEVSNNGGRPQPNSHFTNRQLGPDQAYSTPTDAPHKTHKKESNKFFSLNTIWIILLIGIAVLVVSSIILIVNSSVKNEAAYVNKNEYQAVFVNVAGSSGGQAYFGRIQEINSQYIKLDGVFYLEPGSSSNQFTLNNLSCALYNPEDTMIIKTDQVVFWENLKSNSQVTTDINKWNSDNLACTSTSSQTPSATSTTTTPSTSSSTK